MEKKEDFEFLSFSKAYKENFRPNRIIIREYGEEIKKYSLHFQIYIKNKVEKEKILQEISNVNVKSPLMTKMDCKVPSFTHIRIAYFSDEKVNREE